MILANQIHRMIDASSGAGNQLNGLGLIGEVFLYIYGINICRSCSTIVFTIEKDSQINRPLYFTCVIQASTIFHLLSASMTWMRGYYFFKKIYNWGI